MYAVDVPPLLGSDVTARSVYAASHFSDYASDLAQRQKVAHEAHHPAHSLQ
jgi:hypothetical protein